MLQNHINARSLSSMLDCVSRDELSYCELLLLGSSELDFRHDVRVCLKDVSKRWSVVTAVRRIGRSGSGSKSPGCGEGGEERKKDVFEAIKR